MSVIEFKPGLTIYNIGALPDRNGARYLLARIDKLSGGFIAHSWKQRPPILLRRGYVLIDFGYPVTKTYDRGIELARGRDKTSF